MNKKQKRVNGTDYLLSCVRRGANLVGEPHAVLFDLQLIKEHGVRFGDEFYVIDIDFYAKVLRHGDILLLPDTLSAFRVSHDSASVKMAAQQTSLFQAFVSRLRIEGDYPISQIDSWCCFINLRIRQLMKRVFYLIYMKD